jgi:hypothetical protein
MLKASLLALVALASMASLAGCTVTNANGAPGGADGGTPAADGGLLAPADHALACIAILQCATGTCTETDQACQDACLARGTKDGQAQANALVDCVAKQACADGDCMQTKCKTELDACVTTSTTSVPGAPLEGAPPAGNVPAELVGSWVFGAYGDTNSLDLAADGTGTWGIISAVDFNGYCSTITNVEIGPAVVTADEIVISATDVHTDEQFCGSSKINKRPGTPTTRRLSYGLKSPTQLVVADQACAAKNPQGAAEYCTYTLNKK